MTDYLEQALEGQQEEEQEQWSWEEPAYATGVYRRKKAEEEQTAPEETGQRREGLYPALGTPLGRQEQEEHSRDTHIQTTWLEGNMPLLSIPGWGERYGDRERTQAWLEGVEKRGVGGAGALYRALRRAGQAAQYTGRAGGMELYRPVERPAPTAYLDAAELDRVVQRDARRYDGGFTLY